MTLPGVALKPQREKFLDDAEALLYYDHQFNRHVEKGGDW
jgi:hypothetical protein